MVVVGFGFKGFIMRYCFGFFEYFIGKFFMVCVFGSGLGCMSPPSNISVWRLNMYEVALWYIGCLR